MVTFLLWLGCINIVYYKSSEFGETLIGQYRAKLRSDIMRGKPLKLIKDNNGCITPSTHKLNKDGYFRYRKRVNKGRGKLVMFHRLVWESVYGAIPDGYEIDHICKNRACCNIKHLQMLEGSHHASISNIDRYKQKHNEAKEYWLLTNCNGTELGIKFNVSFSTGCRWVREWKV